MPGQPERIIFLPAARQWERENGKHAGNFFGHPPVRADIVQHIGSTGDPEKTGA